MRNMIFVFFLIILSEFVLTDNARAQEYKYETGAVVGTSFYMGDANRTKLYHQPGVTAGIMHRYNLNLHWSVKSNLLAGTVSGNTAYANNVFPANNEIAFKRTFFDLGSQIEYNFFAFSDKFSYQNAKPYSPYLFTGVGLTLATGSDMFINANVPVGIGFKYKIKNKLNIGIEFSMRKLFGDDFDAPDKNENWNLDAPFGIKSSFYKNQDWYSLTLVFLTWEFGLKQDPCCGQ